MELWKRKMYKIGDRGQGIAKYQMLLRESGSSIFVNGEFTIGMLSAVKAFQRREKLKVTGILDNATMKALDGFKPKKRK